jgi:hypothetical protein
MIEGGGLMAKGFRVLRLLVLLGILLSACSFGLLTPKSFDAGVTVAKLPEFVLRPEDLPDQYRFLSGGESRFANIILINEQGEIEAKEYIVATERVDGWRTKLERVNKEDIAPAAFESQVELFESNQGAQAAISPDWYPAYQEGAEQVKWVEEGCNLGEECLFYYYRSHDPAANLTKLRYEVAFTYRNLLVWVMGRGLEIDMDPEYVLNAAQAIHDKLDQYAEAQAE